MPCAASADVTGRSTWNFDSIECQYCIGSAYLLAGTNGRETLYLGVLDDLVLDDLHAEPDLGVRDGPVGVEVDGGDGVEFRDQDREADQGWGWGGAGGHDDLGWALRALGGEREVLVGLCGLGREFWGGGRVAAC